MTKPRVLFYDIETAPNLGYVWAKYEQNVLDYQREWYMLCVSYRWEDERKTHVVSLLDFPNTYAKDQEDDSEVVRFLWNLLDEADITIAHNGNRFDNRKSNMRFVLEGLEPPSPYKSVDTLLVARRYFMFNSNHLGDLGTTLGLGKKVETGGYDLWRQVMAGNQTAWNKMIRYAKQDVNLLMKVYYKLRPWMTNHPNRAVYGGGQDCPTCGSDKLTKRGLKYTQVMTYQQWQCQSCKAYSRTRTSVPVVRPTVVP